jgi:hypothetical protein
MRAPFFPQISHCISRPDFPNDNKIISGKRMSLDQIFPLTHLTILLSRDDLACKNRMLNIINRDIVIRHLIFRMQGNDIPAGAYLVPHLL